MDCIASEIECPGEELLKNIAARLENSGLQVKIGG
jgi:hypothetical protein